MPVGVERPDRYGSGPRRRTHEVWLWWRSRCIFRSTVPCPAPWVKRRGDIRSSTASSRANPGAHRSSPLRGCLSTLRSRYRWSENPYGFQDPGPRWMDNACPVWWRYGIDWIVIDRASPSQTGRRFVRARSVRSGPSWTAAWSCVRLPVSFCVVSAPRSVGIHRLRWSIQRHRCWPCWVK